MSSSECKNFKISTEVKCSYFIVVIITHFLFHGTYRNFHHETPDIQIVNRERDTCNAAEISGVSNHNHGKSS